MADLASAPSAITIPHVTPVLIGYFPKRTVKLPDSLKAHGVTEIGSVSTCMSRSPDDWINQWRHNDMWVYDTPEIAWSVVPRDSRSEYDLYAYKMFPVKFASGKQLPFDFPALDIHPLPPTYELLGYDTVSRSQDNAFECSPLSCNHMAEKERTNRYCLVDEAETAMQLAAKFEALQCEPGPYYVVEVWREIKSE